MSYVYVCNIHHRVKWQQNKPWSGINFHNAMRIAEKDRVESVCDECIISVKASLNKLFAQKQAAALHT